MLATDEKIEPDLIFFNFFMMDESLEAACKRDWHDMRSYLFLNMRKILDENFRLSVQRMRTI